MAEVNREGAEEEVGSVGAGAKLLGGGHVRVQQPPGLVGKGHIEFGLRGGGVRKDEGS